MALTQRSSTFVKREKHPVHIHKRFYISDWQLKSNDKKHIAVSHFFFDAKNKQLIYIETNLTANPYNAVYLTDKFFIDNQLTYVCTGEGDFIIKYILSKGDLNNFLGYLESYKSRERYNEKVKENPEIDSKIVDIFVKHLAKENYRDLRLMTGGVVTDQELVDKLEETKNILNKLD